MQNLSVLVIHNRYQQPGGEDAVVRAEVEMLRRAGHRVLQYGRDNATIANYSPLRKACSVLQHDLGSPRLRRASQVDTERAA